MNNLTTTNKIILALALIAIPVAARFLWFTGGGNYTPAEISTDIEITIPEIVRDPWKDAPVAGGGTIIIDAAHNNNLAINDLTPFQDRLTARGAEVLIDNGDTALDSVLSTATAYIVIAPTRPFTPAERATILAFTDAGGRLLIVADPTRQVPPSDEDFLTLFDIFFPESAIPSVNSLAGEYGIVYYDDYLYNLTSTEGNYRNVRYTLDNSRHPVTRGINELVLFAAYSMRGGNPLIVGNEDTLSNTRTGETDLTPAVSAADGNVIALGDLSLLTAPYHTIADNDRLLSNLSDWLATSERAWGLTDFPYNFDGPVELIPLGDAATFDPRMLVFTGELQNTFADADIELRLSNVISTTSDAVYVGTYAEAAAIPDMLATSGVTVTLTSETAATEDDVIAGTLIIAGVGEIDLAGTTLFFSAQSGEQTTVVVLAPDDDALFAANDMLVNGFPESCLQSGDVFICSDGKTQDADAAPADEAPLDESGDVQPDADTPPDTVIEPTGLSVFIFLDDDGPGGVRTSGAEWEAALTPAYAVTLWSVTADGLPTLDDLADFDAYVIESGDYAYDEEDFETLFVFFGVDAPVLLFGAQPFPGVSDDDYAPISGLSIGDATGELPANISLSPSDSGVPALVLLAADIVVGEDETALVVYTRGDGNEQAGEPVVVLSEGPEGRFGIAVFAFYRLPADVQQPLALYLLGWLTSGGQG